MTLTQEQIELIRARAAEKQAAQPSVTTATSAPAPSGPLSEDVVQRIRARAAQKTTPTPAPAPIEVPEKQGTMAYLPEAAKETAEQFGKNVVSSGKNFVGGIVEAVKHPVQTAKAVGNVAIGGVEKLIPGEQEKEESFDILVDFYKQRYGGLNNVKETVFNDPVGFASDLTLFLQGGGAAATKVGQLSKVSALEKVGNVASQASKVVDPVSIAAKTTGAVVKPIVNTAGRTVGEGLGISTGAGYGAIREAFRNPSPEFTAALRGKKTGESVLEDATDALHGIKDERSTNYKAQLEEITKNKAQLDISPLREDLDRQLRNYNIKATDDGTLDFSRSTIADKAEAARVQELVEEVRAWGTQPEDLSPIGIDLLKRRLDDFYSPSGQARALVTSLRNKANSILVKAVPQYEKMTSDYQQYTQMIKEIQAGLSLGGKAGADTTIRKLTSVLRQNNEFRKKLVSTLERYSTKDITGQVAGVALSEAAPRGLSRTVASVGVGAALYNPMFWAPLATASPRLVGEFLRFTGLGNKKIQAAMKFAQQKGWFRGAIPNTVFQAGRIKENLEEE